MNLSGAYGSSRGFITHRFNPVASLAFTLVISILIPAFAGAQETKKPIFEGVAGYTIVFPGVPPHAKEGDRVADANLIFNDGTGEWQHLYLCDQKPKDAKRCFGAAIVAPGAKAIAVSAIPDFFSGPQSVLLRTGTSDISTISVVLSPLSWATTIAISFIIAFLLLATVFILARVKKLGTPDGKPRSLLSLFVMDADSNTYSLSKLQLYLWLSATLFAYIYLSLSRIFVQGLFSIPDVQLPVPAQSSLSVAGGLIVALGTTVISAGIASLAGGKGSGEYLASWSDLITSGGVVAPERVQFLVWTLVAVVSYVGITTAMSPATISTLPVIPPELLALSGISAAGYLGGKIARGPGPQIKDLTAKLPTGGGAALTIEINGSGIATQGSAFFIADITNGGQGATDIPIQPAFEPSSVIDSGTGIATHLTLTVPQPAGIVWARTQKYRFTVINPDGERASWEFNAT